MSLLTKGDQARSRAPRLEPHLPGEEGIWVLIFGDMLVFALFFGVFLYYRGSEPDVFATSQLALDTNLGAINTLLLLTSSLLVAMGVKAVRSGRSGSLPAALFGAALLCGLGFGFDKYLEYSEKIAHGITPGTNDFYMYYFILTGLHMFHVIVGMGVLLFMISQARKPAGVASPKRVSYLESGACFWHMVDLLWIVLFPLIYLVRT